MAAPTFVRSYRTPSVTNLYTVPNTADLAISGATVFPGDLVRVLSTGELYRCVGAGNFQAEAAQSDLYSLSSRNVFPNGWYEDFRSGVGKAVADTAAASQLPSGLRIHGQGVAETDSGVVVAYTAGVPVATATATDEDAHLIALSFGIAGGTAEIWTPATNGPYNVEANIAQSSAITLRACGLGFIGATTDALDPPVTGDTVTLTLVQDDVQAVFFDASLTDSDGWFAAHNKANEAASHTTTATGVDLGSTVAAAGTYTLLRVRILANGTMEVYIDGVLKTSIAAAASTSVAVVPVLWLESTSTAVKSMLVKHFCAWSEA